MGTENKQTLPELVQGKQVTEGLLALKEAKADAACLALMEGMDQLTTDVESATKAQGAAPAAKQADKESAAVLKQVLAGTFAVMSLEHPDLLHRVQLSNKSDPEDQGRLAVEVLVEEGSKGAVALVFGLGKVMARREVDQKAIRHADARVGDAEAQVMKSRLKLQGLISDGKIYILEHAAVDHPARHALKRRMKPRAVDASKMKAKMEKVQAREDRKKARTEARQAKVLARFQKRQAREQARLGLTPAVKKMA